MNHKKAVGPRCFTLRSWVGLGKIQLQRAGLAGMAPLAQTATLVGYEHQGLGELVESFM